MPFHLLVASFYCVSISFERLFLYFGPGHTKVSFAWLCFVSLLIAAACMLHLFSLKSIEIKMFVYCVSVFGLVLTLSLRTIKKASCTYQVAEQSWTKRRWCYSQLQGMQYVCSMMEIFLSCSIQAQFASQPPVDSKWRKHAQKCEATIILCSPPANQRPCSIVAPINRLKNLPLPLLFHQSKQ